MTSQETFVAQETFIARLRRHRERNQISIQQIATTTRVKPELFEAFERNDLSGWPRGLYARAWIRGYANVVGLDAIDTVDEFCRLFPQGDRRMATQCRKLPPSSRTRPSTARTSRRSSIAGAMAQAATPAPAQAWYVALARSAYQLLTPRRAARSPAGGPALILLVEPRLERGVVVGHRARVHLTLSG